MRVVLSKVDIIDLTFTSQPYKFNAQLPDYLDLPAAWDALDDFAVIHYEKYKPWHEYEPQLQPVMKFWHEIERLNVDDR